MNNAKGSPK